MITSDIKSGTVTFKYIDLVQNFIVRMAEWFGGRTHNPRGFLVVGSIPVVDAIFITQLLVQ